MSEKNSSVNIGCGSGFISSLTIAFIILKLVGVIDWSWWWVLSPILIVVGIIILILLVIGIVYLIIEINNRRQ